MRIKRLEKYIGREEFGKKEGRKEENVHRKVEIGKKGSPDKRRQEKIESYFSVMKEKEERREEGRKAAGEKEGGEGSRASGPSMGPGALGSLGSMRAATPPRPSQKSRKRGKGLLDGGKGEKEGSFGTLSAWLLREEKATRELPKTREDLEGVLGGKEGNVGGEDRKGRLPLGQRKQEK